MTLNEFWPRYLRDHADPKTRMLHFLGTALAIACLVIAAVTMSWPWLVAAPVCAYGLAWTGHFFIERNKPAAFEHPFLSLVSDLRMFFLWCAGQLEGELGKAGIKT